MIGFDPAYLYIHLPCYMPFSFDQQVNLLNATMVGIVKAFGKMLLQVWFKVLVWLFTLQQETDTTKAQSLAYT